MNSAEQLISVVVPLPESAACLAAFVSETLAVLHAQPGLSELILVDDGSTAETVLVAERLLREHLGVRLIRLSRHFGSDIAIMAGLDSAVGDIIVVLRPDSDPPAELPGLLRRLRAGADVVLGLAVNRPRDGLVFRLCRGVFALVWKHLLRRELPPSTCTLCGLTRRAVNAITRIKQKQPHLSLLSCMVGFPRQSFRYRKAYRSGSVSPRSLLGTIDLGLGLVLASPHSPLRLVSVLGFLAGLLNVLYVVYVLAVNLIKDHVMEGWTTLSLQSALMFLLVFFILGLMAEYVSRIFAETSNQPLYHVLEEKGSSAITAPAIRNVLGQALPDRPIDASREKPHAA